MSGQNEPPTRFGRGLLAVLKMLSAAFLAAEAVEFKLVCSSSTCEVAECFG
jgi:hypothetical protein